MYIDKFYIKEKERRNQRMILQLRLTCKRTMDNVSPSKQPGDFCTEKSRDYL